MSGYSRRDRDEYEYRRYPRENPYPGDRGRDRYSPPRSRSRSRSRERYHGRDRDDHTYHRDTRDDREYRDDGDRNPPRQPQQRGWDSRPEGRPFHQQAQPAAYLAPGVSLPQPLEEEESHGHHHRHPRGDAYDAGKPTSQIIFRGLDKEVTETDLQSFLINQQNAAVESVIVIRDRDTRESRGFAFVKFFGVEAAKEYMDKYFPVVYLGKQKIKIAYSLGRGEEENGWTCDKCTLVNFPRREACYRCGFPRSDVVPSSPPKSLTQKAWKYNDGGADVGNSPSQFLLVRGLDTMMQEETIAKGLEKLEVEPKRILLIRDRNTNISWGFAFVEYQDASLARAAYEKSLEHKAFKIEKSKVKITYCHPGVFVPVYTDAGKYSFKTAVGSSIAYWDEQAYASEWSKAGNTTDEEIERFYSDIKASVAAHAPGATIVQEPVLVSGPDQPSDTAKRENPISDEQQQQQKKKRKVEAPSVKKPTAQIEKWASKREELRGQQTTTTGDSAVIELSEFADTVQMCCLLCKRKFQSVEEIQKHEKLSKLHKTNLEDEGVRKAALEKIEKTRIPTDATESQYRDRARERRIQFNQPHKPDLPHPNPRIAAKQAAAKAAAAESAKGPSPEPEQRVNKGAKLLAAMGWTEGSGLGAEGTGIVEPVRAESYADGVGLGAGTAKVVGVDLANKEDDGSYRAYVRKVKDLARGRYETEDAQDDMFAA